MPNSEKAQQKKAQMPNDEEHTTSRQYYYGTFTQKSKQKINYTS
jgi:hypothetical protein